MAAKVYTYANNSQTASGSDPPFLHNAQNIVVQKIFVRAEGDAAASPASPLDPPLPRRRRAFGFSDSHC